MHDIRLAFRQLFATPVVTIVAVLSLALGIGANTAIFSLLDSLVLRTLAVKDPQQLAIVNDPAGRGGSAMTYAIWREIERRQVFDGAFAWSETRFNLAERGETEFVNGMWASARTFETLGVAPILGRGFTDADDRRGGGPDGPVAVIGYAFWQRRLGGAADAIGRRLTLERIPFTIVGIMPPEFFGPEVGRRIDIAVPIGTEALIRGQESALDEPFRWWLTIMVRLEPGQSLDAGSAALRGVQPMVRAATLPAAASAGTAAIYMTAPYSLVAASTGRSDLRRSYQRPLAIVMVVVVLVLAIACANLANLQLARAVARRHEMTVRVALGASRWRIARQLLTECLVLASAGALLGLMVARWGSRLLVGALSSRPDAVFLDLSLNGRVLGFTAAVTIATVVAFGLMPSFRISRVEPIDALRDDRGVIGGRRMNLAASLILVQVALSVVLLVASGLFIRTFSTLASLPLGFDRHSVLLVTIDMQRARIDPSRRIPILDQALEAVRAVPGIAGAGYSRVTPLGSAGWNGSFEISGGVPLTDRQRRTYRNLVSPGWFAAIGTPILAGRDFSATDRTGGPYVALVNEAFARQFLNGKSPLGHTIRQVNGPRPGPPIDIIGLVADARYESVRAAAPPTVYTTTHQPEIAPASPSMYLSVRVAAGSPARLTRSVAAAITGVHPDLAFTFRALADQVNASLTQERGMASLSGFFGGLAVFLAGLGLYGLTSYGVAQRRREIGIRMALGAGVVVGAGASLWASTFVTTLLYGLEPRDPATLLGSAAVLAAVGALAGWLPAHRAARIDPAEVLRDS